MGMPKNLCRSVKATCLLYCERLFLQRSFDFYTYRKTATIHNCQTEVYGVEEQGYAYSK